MSAHHLIVGGQRSGKSRQAEALALRWPGRVSVVDNFMFLQNSLNHYCAHPDFDVMRGDVRDESLMKSVIPGADVLIPLAAIVGAAGLEPTLAAVRRGATVGLANKECLVCAGDLMKAELEKSGATLLPVDSEHSAIYQVFDFDRRDAVESLILTASGGPFRTYTLELDNLDQLITEKTKVVAVGLSSNVTGTVTTGQMTLVQVTTAPSIGLTLRLTTDCTWVT